MEATQVPFVVGIAGGSASGKTFFMQRLTEALPSEFVCRISQDNYYRKIAEIPKDANGIENFDLPESLDHQLFVQHLSELRCGQPVTQIEYGFNNPLIKPRLLHLIPKPIILVEGLYIYYYDDIARLFDLKIFLDAIDPIRIKRRIERDSRERGYGSADVLYRWKHHVLPNYDTYVKPLRNTADMIINNNEGFDRALEVVVSFLKEKIRKTDR